MLMLYPDGSHGTCTVMLILRAHMQDTLGEAAQPTRRVAGLGDAWQRRHRVAGERILGEAMR